MSKKRELIPFSPCIHRSASGNELLDGVGFAVDQLHCNLVTEWSVRFSAAQTTQASRWIDFFSAQEHLHPEVARQRMRVLARVGVPPSLRSTVWTQCALAMLQEKLQSFDASIIVGASSVAMPFDIQIDKDIPRTFSQHPRFSSDELLETVSLRPALRRVLRAFCCRSPCVGYCQGLNFIAAMLLLALNNEQQALCILCALCQFMLPTYFGPALQGVAIDASVLSDLLSLKLPDLQQHFHKISLGKDMLLSAFAQWFMCIWAVSLPSESIFRVWDAILTSGKAHKTMLRVGLAVLMLLKPSLMQCNTSEEALLQLRNGCQSFFDSESLVFAAYNTVGSMPKSLWGKLTRLAARAVLCGPASHDVFVLHSLALITLNDPKHGTMRKVLTAAPDARQVWGGDDNGDVRMWDADAGNLLFSDSTPDHRRCIAIAAIKRTEIWAGLAGGSIIRWCVRTLAQLEPQLAHVSDDLNALVGGHGDVLAVSGGGDSVCIWMESHLHTEFSSIKKHSDIVLRFPNEEVLCLCSSAEIPGRLYCGTHATLTVYDLKQRCILHCINMAHSGGVTDMVEVYSTSRCRPQLWAIHGNREIGVWDAVDFGARVLHRGHGGVGRCVASPDGCVWTASLDGNVDVWRVKNERHVRTVKMLPQAVCSMAVCENAAAGVHCMWASSYDGELTSWVIDELLEYKHLGSAFMKTSPLSQSGVDLTDSISADSLHEPEDPACLLQ